LEANDRSEESRGIKLQIANRLGILK
jgi:hypothetical protein